jgi:hypothetical protein
MSKKLPPIEPGQEFGLWTVQPRYAKGSGGQVLWECKCKCGNISYVGASDLWRGKSTKCKGCRNLRKPQKWSVSGDVARTTISGRVCIVDASDACVVALHRWRLDFQREYVYASTIMSGREVQMHRMLLSDILTDERPYVDHRNGNTLDNRRSCNIRPASLAENSRNNASFNPVSGYKGVGATPSGKWCAQIKDSGVTRHLGIFDSPHVAANAYNRAAVELFGEFARLNVVPTDGAK